MKPATDNQQPDIKAPEIIELTKKQDKTVSDCITIMKAVSQSYREAADCLDYDLQYVDRAHFEPNVIRILLFHFLDFHSLAIRSIRSATIQSSEAMEDAEAAEVQP